MTLGNIQSREEYDPSVTPRSPVTSRRLMTQRSPSGRSPCLGLLVVVLAVVGCGARPAHSAPEGTEPEVARVLAVGSLVRLLLPTGTPYREAEDGFSVRLRVENASPEDVYLDLGAPTLVHPSQFGPLTTPEPPSTPARLNIDERRLPADPLREADREALRQARRDGELTRLRRGESLDVYVPFHNTGARMFMGFATPWVFISLDGHLDALSESGETARVSLAWSDTRSSADTDIVLPMPVVLATRSCRERRIQPRGGSPEWPVITCPVP